MQQWSAHAQQQAPAVNSADITGSDTDALLASDFLLGCSGQDHQALLSLFPPTGDPSSDEIWGFGAGGYDYLDFALMESLDAMPGFPAGRGICRTPLEMEEARQRGEDATTTSYDMSPYDNALSNTDASQGPINGLGLLQRPLSGGPSIATASSSTAPTTIQSTPIPSISSAESANLSASLSPLESGFEGGSGDRKRKRERNTEAARRYRQRRVDHVSELEDALAAMTKERDDLRLKLARSEAEADVLRDMVHGRR